MLWGWSFPALELIVKVALWIAFAAGGIAAVSAFIAGYVGYELTDAMQKEADLRIVEAQSRGEEAKARAAVAEQRAAEAQLALEKFKAPRNLPLNSNNVSPAQCLNSKGFGLCWERCHLQRETPPSST